MQTCASRGKKRTKSAIDDAILDLAQRLSSAVQAGIYLEAQPYHCPCCGETFPTAKKLNGHISGHKMKGEWKEDEYGDWKQRNEERRLVLEELDMNFKSHSD